MKRLVLLPLPHSLPTWAAGRMGAAIVKAGLSAGLLALYANAAPASSAVHTVIIDGMRFLPETIEVKAGDTIVWRNKDPFPHTVATNGPGFASAPIAPQGQWTFKAGKPGRYAYLCTLHRTMRALLIVK